MVATFALELLDPLMPEPPLAPTGKNIVLCFDGTNNEFANPETNVARLYSVLCTETQATFYDPGVGTLRRNTVFSRTALGGARRSLNELAGLAFGYGLFHNVEEGYRYLMHHYEEGDQVYLFGFSRGAYTARVLAGLVSRLGLLRPGGEHLYPYAFDLYRKRKKTSTGWTPLFGKMQRFRNRFGREVPFRYLGLWDSVSALGWAHQKLRLPRTDTNPDVQSVRHALALDERRGFYLPPPMLPASEEQRYEHAWFAGVHSDVGGGYGRDESGLSRLALEWVLIGALRAGLRLRQPDGAKDALKYVQVTHPMIPPAYARHRSLNGTWNLLEIVPKWIYSHPNDSWSFRANRWRQRPFGPKPRIHASAYKLDEESKEYALRPLPGDANKEPWEKLADVLDELSPAS